MAKSLIVLLVTLSLLAFQNCAKSSGSETSNSAGGTETGNVREKERVAVGLAFAVCVRIADCQSGVDEQACFDQMVSLNHVPRYFGADENLSINLRELDRLETSGAVEASLNDYKSCELELSRISCLDPRLAALVPPVDLTGISRLFTGLSSCAHIYR